MSRTTLRVGLSLLAISAAAGCAQREIDKKPEMAKDHGYYVSQDESVDRGGIGGYVQVPSNSERARLNRGAGKAGVATKGDYHAKKTIVHEPEADKVSANKEVPILKDKDQTILFNLGDAGLREESLPLLDKIATQLKAAPAAKVKVEGYSDKLGDADGNKMLSQDRAATVCDYLTSQGISSDRLEVASYGDEKAKDSLLGNPEDRKVVISLG